MGPGEVTHPIEYLPARQEDWRWNPSTHGKAAGDYKMHVYNSSTVEAETDSLLGLTGIHWPASLAYFVSSRLVRNQASK